MRSGLAISATLHAALLGYGLVAFSAPKPLMVADMEAFPVDIVPVSELSQIQQGDKKAPKAERSATVPTTKPQEMADARNVGNNSVDNQSPPTPTAKPVEVKAASAPPPQPEPAPKPAEKPVEQKAEPKPVPAPAPKPEVAAKPEPKPEVKPEAKPEPAPEKAVEKVAEALPLPTTAPPPQTRPQPARPDTAQAQPQEKKAPEKPAQQQAQKPKSDNQKALDLDQVAALLDQRAPSGGGAKRSTQTAALGGRTNTGGQTLSQSEMDGLRGQLAGCWSIPAGAADGGGLRTSVRFSLDEAGKLIGRPTVESASGNRQFDESAVRAIQKCNQTGLLVPAGKHDVWAEVLVNFDPAEMF